MGHLFRSFSKVKAKYTHMPRLNADGRFATATTKAAFQLLLDFLADIDVTKAIPLFSNFRKGKDIIDVPLNLRLWPGLSSLLHPWLSRLLLRLNISLGLAPVHTIIIEYMINAKAFRWLVSLPLL